MSQLHVLYVILAMSVSMAPKLFNMQTTRLSHLAEDDRRTEYQRQRTARREVDLDHDDTAMARPIIGSSGCDGRADTFAQLPRTLILQQVRFINAHDNSTRI